MWELVQAGGSLAGPTPAGLTEARSAGARRHRRAAWLRHQLREHRYLDSARILPGPFGFSTQSWLAPGTPRSALRALAHPPPGGGRRQLGEVPIETGTE